MLYSIINIIMPRVPNIFSIFTFCVELIIVLICMGFILAYLIKKFIMNKISSVIYILSFVLAIVLAFDIFISFYNTHVEMRQRSNRLTFIDIQTAVQTFLADSNCYDFSDIYDKDGNKIIIKQKDKESLEKLLYSLKSPVYYKGKAFGPYISDKGYKSYIDLRDDRKNYYKGYRLEINKDGYVNFIPVRKESEEINVGIVFLPKRSKIKTTESVEAENDYIIY